MDRLKFTLKAFPVVTVLTIGLCYLTQHVAGWCGIKLPDQANLELARRCAGWNLTFASFCAQVVLLMPAVEEVYFRHFVFRRAHVPLGWRSLVYALAPTGLFALIGASVQSGLLGENLQNLVVQTIPENTWRQMWIGLGAFMVVEYALRVFAGRLLAKLSRWAILVASSILFSAAHYIVQPFPDAAFLALFFFGLAQCWLYEKTERLWCAMLNHALFNLANLILLFSIPQ